MKIFLDTADVDMIGPAYSTGLIDCVTTNPTLIMKSGRDPVEVIKEISYGWNILEFELEMAKLGKRPALPMQIKTPNKELMQKEKNRLLKISEDRRHHIISFFEIGKDYTVPELKNMMGDDNMGMNASVISGLMNGLVQMGRLKKYRLDYQKNKPDYWLYYLPNQALKERTHD